MRHGLLWHSLVSPAFTISDFRLPDSPAFYPWMRTCEPVCYLHQRFSGLTVGEFPSIPFSVWEQTCGVLIESINQTLIVPSFSEHVRGSPRMRGKHHLKDVSIL